MNEMSHGDRAKHKTVALICALFASAGTCKCLILSTTQEHKSHHSTLRFSIGHIFEATCRSTYHTQSDTSVDVNLTHASTLPYTHTPQSHT